MRKLVMINGIVFMCLSSAVFAGNRTTIFPDSQCTEQGKTAATSFCFSSDKQIDTQNVVYHDKGAPAATSPLPTSCANNEVPIEMRATCASTYGPTTKTAVWSLDCSDFKLGAPACNSSK